MKQSKGVALQMPGSYVEMSEEEKCYIEGGYVVGAYGLTATSAQNVYQALNSCDSYESLASFFGGTALGIVCAKAIENTWAGWGVTTSYAAAYFLKDYIGAFASAKRTFKNAASKGKAITMLSYSNGEWSWITGRYSGGIYN